MFISILGGLAGLIAALFLALEWGRRLGARRFKDDPTQSNEGLAAVEGAVFGLLGLMIAFTFSGANARLEARRELIVREVNAIGTAWFRLDLLDGADRSELQAKFRSYIDARLAATRQEIVESSSIVSQLQASIWAQALAATRAPEKARAATA